MSISKLTIAASLLAVVSSPRPTYASSAPSDKARSLTIVARFTPPATCEISVEGQVFVLPADQGRMAAAMRKLHREWKFARFAGNSEMPYRCAGHAIFIARSSGFKMDGFISKPPD